MKKNLPIIIVVVVLIIIVIISGICIINKNTSSKQTYQPLPSEYDNMPVEQNNVEYSFEENVAYSPSTLDNSFDDTEAFKTIAGTTYKNINSIPQNMLGTYNYNKYNYGDSIEYSHDKDDEKLFDEDEVIFPKALFLVNNDINAFYNYNGEFYFIPVIKCDTKEEERILFRDYDLSIGKNDGSICVNGKKLNIAYNSSGLDFEGLFNSYFILNPELSNTQMNLYKTNIDLNDNTVEIRLATASNLDDKLESMCNTFITIKNNDEFDLSVVPMDLGKHVGNYSNLFYKESNYIYISESGETINTDSSKVYYLFDSGFELIMEE